MNIDKKILVSNIGLFLVAILWAGGFIVTKNTLDLIDPIYLNFLRFLVAFVLISIIFMNKYKKMNKKDLKAGAIIGIFMFIAFTTQTIGLQYTTVSNQAFLTASSVVIVPFILWIRKIKKLDKYEVLAAFFSFIGIALLSISSNFTIGYGDTLSLVCAIFFAYHLIAIGKFAPYHDPIILIIIQFGVVALLSLISCIVFRTEFTKLDTTISLSIGYVSIFSTIIAFGIQNIAQKYTSPTNTAIILSLESVFGTIFSIIFLKEELTIKLFAGCILMFIGIITAETKLSFLKSKNL